MSQNPFENDLKITVIDGPCTGTGNSEVDLGGTLYSQVRFADGTRIAGLIADGYLASFIEGGGKKFYVAEKAMRGYSVLLGVVDDDGTFHDIDDNTWAKGAKQTVVTGVVAIVIGIPLSAIAVGIPCLIHGVIAVSRGKRMQKLVKAARVIRDEHHASICAKTPDNSHIRPLTRAA